MNLVVIIAKYKESVEWTKGLQKPFVIYNKNLEDNKFFEFNLPNKGFETDTFLHHIIKNYDSLSDYVAFLQGNPFDHCYNSLELINNFKFDVDFECLGPRYYRDGGPLEPTLDWAKFCNIQINSPIKFISGAQCIVSKNTIMKRKKESYQEIHEKVCQQIDFNSHTKYFFEYLWPTILGFNDDLII